MKHPELQYVDFAKDEVYMRNNIQNVSDIKKLIQDGGQAYSTYFRYGEDIKKWLQTHKNAKGYPTVQGYTGIHYSDFFPIDVDCADLSDAFELLKKILATLENAYDVNLSNLWIYFSGSKGFHLLIPQPLIGYEPSEELSQQFRAFAKEILHGIDFDESIYDTTRLFRCNNTLNKKGNKFKIPLTITEIQNFSLDEILELAKEPRTIERMQLDEIMQNDVLHNIFHSKKFEKKKLITKIENVQHDYKLQPFRKLCYENMLRQTVGLKDRNNICARLAYYLKDTGVLLSIALNTLIAWGYEVDKSGKDFTPEEVQRTVCSVYSNPNISYGCNDTYCKNFCTKKCDLYKYPDSDVEKDYFGFEEIEYTTDFAPRALSNIPQLDYLTKAFTFDCVTIWTGITSVGKTTLLSQMAVESMNQGHNVFYFNGEQTASNFKGILYRQLCRKDEIYPKQFKNTVIYEYFVTDEAQERINKILKNKMFVYNNNCKKSIAQLIRAMDRARIEDGVKVFMLDNFMQIEVDEGTNTEYSDIMEQLRTFAVNKQVHIHLVAHAKKIGDYKTRPTIYDISGTFNIVNKAYNVISIIRTDTLDDECLEYSQLEKDLAKSGYAISECGTVLEVLKTKGTKTGLVGLKYNDDTKRCDYVKHDELIFEKYKQEKKDKSNKRKKTRSKSAWDDFESATDESSLPFF